MVTLRSFLTVAVALSLVNFAAAQSATGQFTLTVYQPGSPLHGEVVNAAGEAFSLGGSPATYCPLTNQQLCPVGNQTIFAGMSALSVCQVHYRYVILKLMSENRSRFLAVNKFTLAPTVLWDLLRLIPHRFHLELISATSQMSLSPVLVALRSM